MKKRYSDLLIFFIFFFFLGGGRGRKEREAENRERTEIKRFSLRPYFLFLISKLKLFILFCFYMLATYINDTVNSLVLTILEMLLSNHFFVLVFCLFHSLNLNSVLNKKNPNSQLAEKPFV